MIRGDLPLPVLCPQGCGAARFSGNLKIETFYLEGKKIKASFALLQHFGPDISRGGGGRPAEVGGEKQRPQGAPGIF